MRRTSLRKFILALFAILLIFTAGCAGPPRMSSIHSLEELGEHETILVGRIELVPALALGEQALHPAHKGFYNSVILLTGSELKNPDLDRRQTFRDHILAPFGEVFFVRTANTPLYYLGGVVYMDTAVSFWRNFLLDEPNFVQKAFLPGGVKIDQQPDDRAIYIGTLRYYRDEFFSINRIDVVDEYETVKKEFAARFGDRISLRKGLVVK